MNNETFYNILTIDGGGIRGIIPAVTLEKMEDFAYEYAISQNYTIPLYQNSNGELRKKLPMMDLFDMMSGTSTGSILSTALSLIKAENRSEPLFWAGDALGIYEDAGPIIF